MLGSAGPKTVSGAAYGVGITLQAPDKALLQRMRAALPPDWIEKQHARSAGEPAPELRFTLSRDVEHGYRITLNDSPLLQDSVEAMLDLLPTVIRQYLAAEARDAVFVHAGAVAVNGRGIVIPGKSFSGKTTLVAALVRAGAQYYSDEYAVIRPDGKLVPFPKDLSLRLVEGDRAQTDHSVGEIGGVVGSEPVPIGLLVVTEYRASAKWEPSELSAAQGLVELLAHAEPVQERPAPTLATVRQALQGAQVLKGYRGEAESTAAALLALLA
jgi:hypothetical protein